MDTILHLFLGLFTALVDGAATTLPLTITPTRAHIDGRNQDNLIVSCGSPVTFDRCQFRVGDGPVMDTLMGTNSHLTASHVFEGDRGWCQVALPPSTLGTRKNYVAVIGCRVRQEDGDWSYATMPAHWSFGKALPLEVAANQVVAAPGETVSVLATTPTALWTCQVQYAGEWVSVRDSATPCRDKVCYHGNGLARGECGATLRNLTEEDNGVLWLHLTDGSLAASLGTDMGTSFRHVLQSLTPLAKGAGFVFIIVAKPPKSVTLQYKTREAEDGTVTLNAWCSVIGGRPTPNVTWYIGGVQVSEGVARVPRQKWAWPSDERNLKQSLTRKLLNEDSGKELKCVATSYRGQTTNALKLLPSIIKTREFVASSKLPEITNFGEENDFTKTPEFEASSDYPEIMNSREKNGYLLDYSVEALVLFGLVIFIIVAVICITAFIVVAWRRHICCFKRRSNENSSSLDQDVMDLTLRQDVKVESYLEPIQPAQSQDYRDSYFMPSPEATWMSNKPEWTLPRKPKPSSNAGRYKMAPVGRSEPKISEPRGDDPKYVNVAPNADECEPIYEEINE